MRPFVELQLLWQCTLCTITFDRHWPWVSVTDKLEKVMQFSCNYSRLSDAALCRVTAATAMQPWMESRGWCRLLLNYFGR